MEKNIEFEVIFEEELNRFNEQVADETEFAYNMLIAEAKNNKEQITEDLDKEIMWEAHDHAYQIAVGQGK